MIRVRTCSVEKCIFLYHCGQKRHITKHYGGGWRTKSVPTGLFIVQLQVTGDSLHKGPAIRIRKVFLCYDAVMTIPIPRTGPQLFCSYRSSTFNVSSAHFPTYTGSNISRAAIRLKGKGSEDSALAIGRLVYGSSGNGAEIVHRMSARQIYGSMKEPISVALFTKMDQL